MARGGTWVLVSSGVRAIVLPHIDKDRDAASIEIVSKAESSHLGEILSDKAGRSFASGNSGRRSAMEPGSDPVLHDMQQFARETLGVLETHLRAGDLTRLAVFASPKMLGVLRQEMPADLRAVVFLERDANIVNLPEADLRDAVIYALAKEKSR